MAIRTVLFDLGNVLVRFCHERMCRQLAAACGKSAREVRSFLLESGFQLEFERGRVDERQFLASFEAFAGRRLDAAALYAAASDIFEENRPMPDVVARIKSLNVRLVLLSNTCGIHFENVRRGHRLVDEFDAHVLSYEVGACKPEPAIYERALAAIDCDPSECLYTDDIPEFVAAGAGYGLNTIRFENPQQFCRAARSFGLPVAG